MKTSKMKIFILASLATTCLGAASLTWNNAVTASANSIFEMVNGASVRMRTTADETAIRFIAKVSDTEKNYRMLILPTDILEYNKIEAEDDIVAELKTVYGENYEQYFVDFGEDIDNALNAVKTLRRVETCRVLVDEQTIEKTTCLTNCKNCGAPLTGTKCEYCGTEYAPKIEKPYCEEAKDLIKLEDAENAILDSLFVTQENLQNSFFVLHNTSDDTKRALTDFSKEIKMTEAEQKVLGFFVQSLVAVALIGIIVLVLNLFV